MFWCLRFWVLVCLGFGVFGLGFCGVGWVWGGLGGLFLWVLTGFVFGVDGFGCCGFNVGYDMGGLGFEICWVGCFLVFVLLWILYLLWLCLCVLYWWCFGFVLN